MCASALMWQLLEECTEKLSLHKAARRLFLDDGQEVMSEDNLERDAEVYVSTGEPFRNPIKDMLSMCTCNPCLVNLICQSMQLAASVKFIVYCLLHEFHNNIIGALP